VPDDENAVHRLVRQVERALARYEHALPRLVHLALSRDDQWLFLNWKSWRLRYAVTVDFILTTLLDHFNRIRQKTRGTISLGVSVPLLTGPRAEEIIKTAVADAFPNGENLDVQRYQKAQRNHEETYARVAGSRQEEAALAAQIAKEVKRGWRLL
jgi:hypothetical protein